MRTAAYLFGLLTAAVPANADYASILENDQAILCLGLYDATRATNRVTLTGPPWRANASIAATVVFGNVLTFDFQGEERIFALDETTATARTLLIQVATALTEGRPVIGFENRDGDYFLLEGLGFYGCHAILLPTSETNT